MSTNIISNKIIEQVVGTIMRYYENHFGSEDLLKRQLANDIHDLLSVAQNTMPGQIKDGECMSSDALKPFLYDFLVLANKDEYMATYPQHKHAELESSWEDAEKYLETATFPSFADTLKGISVLHAMLHDINCYTNLGANTDLAKAFLVFEDKLARSVLQMQPNYPRESSETKDLAVALVSLKTTGNQFYGVQDSMKSLMNAYEFDIPDHKGIVQTIHGADYLASLMEQLGSGKNPIKLPTEWGRKSSSLPTSTQLSEQSFYIQSDIPDASMEDSLSAAHLFNTLSEQVQKMEPTDFVGLNDEPFDVDEYNMLIEKVKDFSQRHDFTLSHNLPNFKRAFSIVYGQEKDLYANEI